jgi:retinol dehydrogenase 14
MAEQRGPVVLVTGATDGIGRETAMELARRGARVIVHGRNARKAEETTEAIRALGAGEPLAPLVVDLSRLADVRAAPAILDARGVLVDVIVHNAGVYMRDGVLSADGFEMTLAVNHLAPFALTHALLASHAGSRLSRVVNVSSVAHTRGRIDLEDLSFERRGFDHYATYAASKLANVLFTVELARRLAGRGVTVNALHPGVVSTKLLTDGMGFHGSQSVSEGAATAVRLALDADLAGVTGGYFSSGRPAPRNPVVEDAALAKQFYEISAKMTGVEALPG